MFQEYNSAPSQKLKHRVLPVLPNSASAFGYFDGAQQSVRCGAGGVIKIKEAHIINLKLFCGQGTN